MLQRALRTIEIIISATTTFKSVVYIELQHCFLLDHKAIYNFNYGEHFSSDNLLSVEIVWVVQLTL